MITIRERILTVIAQRLASVPNVGGVFEPGEEGDAEVGAQVALGKLAIQWEVGDDQADDSGPQQVEGADTMQFRVGVLVHLPNAAPSGRTWQGLAAETVAQVYVLYAANDEAGQWADTIPLAVQTQQTVMGGGVFYSPQGTRATYHEFEITYRIKRGDPTVAV